MGLPHGLVCYFLSILYNGLLLCAGKGCAELWALSYKQVFFTTETFNHFCLCSRLLDRDKRIHMPCVHACMCECACVCTRVCVCKFIIYVHSKVLCGRICFPVKFIYAYAISLQVKDMNVRVHVQIKCVPKCEWPLPGTQTWMLTDTFLEDEPFTDWVGLPVPNNNGMLFSQESQMKMWHTKPWNTEYSQQCKTCEKLWTLVPPYLCL